MLCGAQHSYSTGSAATHNYSIHSTGSALASTPSVCTICVKALS